MSDTNDRYLLISADGHAGPPADLYRDYLEERFRPRFDEHQAELSALREMAQQNTEFRDKWEARTGDGGLLAAYDSDARNERLDGEGVAVEVLFPDADVLGTGRVASSPFGSGLGSPIGVDAELVLAGARAHNRWLADFCAKQSDRRLGVGVVPITCGVEEAVAEIEAVHDLGLRGVMIPTRWMDAPAYHMPCYEPVWDALERLGLVLHTHSGAGPADYDIGPGFIAIYATEAYWWAARPLWVLLWSGVFERHPELKYVVAENGAWWLPDILAKMDEKYLGGHNTEKLGDVFRENLSMKPSEYVERNVFLAASTPGAEDVARRHEVGVGNLLWGNDFPHPEGTFPYTRERVRQRFGDVPRAEAERILGLNAAELYGLDVGALAPLVERIGPLVDEIHGDTPLQEIP
ncbi:MAG TPA: amidohydrolase family protein [Acidimicrobiales bacterium]|nr:amidohydrolase family protein [Acidimicrobiales bacterium]